MRDVAHAGSMLVSRDRDQWAVIDSARVRAGRFLTDDAAWLRPHIARFIAATGIRSALDPFVGEGHLLDELIAQSLVDEVAGYDIESGAYERRDSLVHIPPTDSIIVTNPPYLARHSARRKRVYESVARWFDGASGDHSDLYQVALERMLDASQHVIAILPETFIHSRTFRERLESVTVLEQHHPFSHTDCPVLVACFGPHATKRPDVWLDDVRLGTIDEVDSIRTAPFTRAPGLAFNVVDGAVGLRAVDGTDGSSPIAFMPAAQFTYGDAGIKHSSRLMTRIRISDSLDAAAIEALCDAANTQLAQLRSGIGDLALSPFKGNDRIGRRRRRIDYRQAARLLGSAISNTSSADSIPAVAASIDAR